MNNAVEIIAHRGASGDAPENTRASVMLGWSHGADALEIDIQLTADGKIVVIHDKDTLRTTGVDLKISRSTLADLQSLDAGRWKGEAFAGEKIPTLEEILALIPNGKRLYIEVKSGLGIVLPLQTALARVNPESISIICFDSVVLRSVKLALPAVETLFLARHRANQKTGTGPLTSEDLIRLCRECGFQGVDLDSYWPLNKREVRKLKDAGLKCCIWTVNRPYAGRRLASAGVEGITTDRPGWLREDIKRAGNPFAAFFEAFWTRMASRMPY